MGTGLILAGLGLAASSLLGPLVAGAVEYPLSRSLLSQTVGLDAFSLLVVAPLCVFVGVLAIRGHPAATVLALGPSLYLVYMMAQYIVGPDYRFFPEVLLLHLALLVTGEILVVLAWSAIEPRELPATPPGRRRASGVALLSLAGFILLRYLPGLLGSLGARPLPAESRQDPAMFWTILVLDLGIVVPGAVAAGTALLRHDAGWAQKALYAVVGWFALVGPAVAVMGGAMHLDDDPHMSPATLGVFLAAATAAVALATWSYRPLFIRDDGS